MFQLDLLTNSLNELHTALVAGGTKSTDPMSSMAYDTLADAVAEAVKGCKQEQTRAERTTKHVRQAMTALNEGQLASVRIELNAAIAAIEAE